MAETSGARLRGWLLLSLDDLGGSAPRRDVHANVERLFGEEFTPSDRARRVVKGKPRELAWKNNLDSLYDRMKKSGHLAPSERQGDWTLAGPGRTELLAMTPPDPPVVVREGDLLADFRPGDSSAYLAQVRGTILVKTREHEEVLAQYGNGIVHKGWRPVTSVHPRDLELRKGDQVCLAEVKMIRLGNATEAVRQAVAQLYEYRHFFYPRESLPMLLAIFSDPIGEAYAAYLQSLGIAAVWRTGETWSGNVKAVRQSLVP